MDVLYHEVDPFYMEPTKIKLPQGEYIINDQLKTFCENLPDQTQVSATTAFLSKHEALPISKLVEIYLPPGELHRHILIAISGFLSEKDDQHESWAMLRGYCEKHEIPLFALQWQAQAEEDVKNIAG